TPDGLSETYINNALGTEPTKRLKTMNGPIESDIRIWTLGEPASVGARVPARPLDDAGSDLAGERGRSTLQKGEGEPNTPVQGVTHVTPRSDAGSLHAEQGTATAAIDSTEFRNRLTKMAKHRAKWARRAGVSCYRVYDADLPDFKVAIDLYQGAAQTRDEGKKWLHIAEYRAPKEVDEATAHARLAEVLRIAPEVLDVRTQDVFLKRREQAKGGSQYQQSSDSKKSPGYHIINEGGLKFEVDLASKLDTGIFLDHRQVRNLLRDKAAGRDCLNLFAYTGSASVYMADGAAKSVTTVDLSQTYLDWAQRNMALNRLDLKRGLDLHYEKADVLRWVADQRAQRKPAYDLIFCDVPTFSNSTAMGKKTWDVQRDHVELLISISRLLRHDGEAVFSTNLRNFKPDLEALEKARVSLQNISTQTVPPDYERSPSIHHCFVLKRLPLS
ncbi:MAG: class I SAM-dependent methyltransferase, partial [Coriobacteriia bacterium]|nr:class I SAM-dependent methyltransferase [Coriobacteriia bacterium]